MGDRERICRFCFETCDGAFKAIEKSTRIILNMLLIKTNLAVSSEPVMCTNCAEILQKCFDFKTICLRNTHKITNGISEDELVCGLCMGLLKNCSFAILNIEDDDMKEKIMLEKCLPELDLITTKKLVICAACHESLQSYFNFVTNSMIAEEKIENYREAASVNNKDLIILSNVRQFVLGNMCEDEDNRTDVMKTEDETSSDPQLTFENIKEDDNEINIIKVEDTLTWEDKVQVVKREEEFCVETGSDLTDVEVKEEIILSCDGEETDVKRDQHKIDSDAILERRQSGHTKPKMFSCGVCPFKSSAKYRLMVHIANKHKKEAIKRGLPPAVCITPGNAPDDILYKCVDCPYTTTIKGRLIKHLLSHQPPQDKDALSGMVHKCPLCDYQAKIRDNLKEHIRNVHKPVQPKERDKCSSQMKWTAQQELQLIDAYKKSKLLWDARHPRHCNKTCKNDAWEEIATQIDVCADECRKKMASLLASLRREKLKIRKSLASGAGDVYKSRWFAFKPLQFLLNKAKPREGRTTLQIEDNMDSTSSNIEAIATVESQTRPTTSVGKSRKRKVEEARRDGAVSVLQPAASNKKDEDDEIQTFCHLVANKLKKYSPVTCIAVQQQIMNVLFNADRGFYDGLSYPVQREFSTQYNYPQFTYSQYQPYSNNSTSNNYSRPSPASTATSASEDTTFEDLI